MLPSRLPSLHSSRHCSACISILAHRSASRTPVIFVRVSAGSRIGPVVARREHKRRDDSTPARCRAQCASGVRTRSGATYVVSLAGQVSVRQRPVGNQRGGGAASSSSRGAGGTARVP